MEMATNFPLRLRQCLNGRKAYALLRSGDQTSLMEVKEDASGQHLVQITNQSEKESLLDAYQVAVEASPAE